MDFFLPSHVRLCARGKARPVRLAYRQLVRFERQSAHIHRAFLNRRKVRTTQRRPSGEITRLRKGCLSIHFRGRTHSRYLSRLIRKRAEPSFLE